MNARIFRDRDRRGNTLLQDVPLAATPGIAADLDRTLLTPLEYQVATEVPHVPPTEAEAYPKTPERASNLYGFCILNSKPVGKMNE